MTYDHAIGIDGRDEPKQVSPYVDAYHRDHRERLIADLATCQQANAALRRTIDRVHHYGEPE